VSGMRAARNSNFRVAKHCLQRNSKRGRLLIGRMRGPPPNSVFLRLLVVSTGVISDRKLSYVDNSQDSTNTKDLAESLVWYLDTQLIGLSILTPGLTQKTLLAVSRHESPILACPNLIWPWLRRKFEPLLYYRPLRSVTTQGSPLCSVNNLRGVPWDQIELVPEERVKSCVGRAHFDASLCSLDRPRRRPQRRDIRSAYRGILTYD
jgi:hypothetical protein